ncbi:MAG: hypothetical protein KER_03083 [Kerstersia gyiorum]|uniref:hypothetical protein n=1 Tax=Kerstersia gyiorum TaxID=206506 RepID=UPI0030CA7458
MGLRDEITADIAAAFDADLADAVSTFTGSRFEPSGPADPISQTQPGSTVTYTGRGVFGGYGVDVVDGISILRTDTKLTALQAEVTGTPKVDDDVVRGDQQFKVISIGADPAAVSYSIQLRGV